MTEPQLNLFADLEGAIAAGNDERRGEILLRVAELFEFGVAQYTADQVDFFDTVIATLSEKIEKSARAALARRLSGIPTAPPKIIRKLSFDADSDVAGPVLTYSPVLGDTTLVECVRALGPSHMVAIARRRTVSELVTDALVELGDRAVLRTIIDNKGSRFSENGFAIVVKRSEGDEALTTATGLRPDLPRHHFLKLLVRASGQVRAKLEAANPHAAPEIHQVVREVSRSIAVRAAAKARDFSDALFEVHDHHEKGTLNDGAMQTFALEGRYEHVTAGLATLCDLPIQAVERAMGQDRPEALLVMARAIGLSWPTTKAVLRMKAGAKGLTHHDIERAITSFERIKPATALQVLQIQRSREALMA